MERNPKEKRAAGDGSRRVKTGVTTGSLGSSKADLRRLCDRQWTVRSRVCPLPQATKRSEKAAPVRPAIRCSLVAQGLCSGERLGEICAGMPGLTVVRVLLPVAAEQDLDVVLLRIKRAFLYSNTKRSLDT